MAKYTLIVTSEFRKTFKLCQRRGLDMSLLKKAIINNQSSIMLRFRCNCPSDPFSPIFLHNCERNGIFAGKYNKRKTIWQYQ